MSGPSGHLAELCEACKLWGSCFGTFVDPFYASLACNLQTMLSPMDGGNSRDGSFTPVPLGIRFNDSGTQLLFHVKGCSTGTCESETHGSNPHIESMGFSRSEIANTRPKYLILVVLKKIIPFRSCNCSCIIGGSRLHQRLCENVKTIT